MCVCGHNKSDHIYEQGACRPGFVCSCSLYKANKNHTERNVASRLKRKSNQRKQLKQLQKALAMYQSMLNITLNKLDKERNESKALQEELVETRKKIPWWRT